MTSLDKRNPSQIINEINILAIEIRQDYSLNQEVRDLCKELILICDKLNSIIKPKDL